MRKLLFYSRIILTLAIVLQAPVLADNEEQGKPMGVVEQARQNRLELRRTDNEPLPPAPRKTELETILGQVKAISDSQPVKPAKKASPSPTPVEPEQTKPPVVEENKEETPRQPDADVPKPQTGLPLDVVKKIEKLPYEKIVNPVGLADTFFLSGNLEAAALVYDLALKNEKDSTNKAWLLFQLANCRKESDPDVAKALYKQLIVEYADSDWSAIARVQLDLIEWLQVNKPYEILAKQNELQAEAEPSPKLVSK